MPKQKRRRGLTGCVRRRPIREEQEQYRHSHGLNTHECTMRQCFQVQMTSASHATNILTRNVADLLSYATMVHGNQVQDNVIHQEVTLLMAMQQSTIQPLGEHYFQTEARLCDVPDDVHDEDHDYGRTINALTDWQALHYTNFTKPQLKRIYRCFNFGHQLI